MEEHQLQLVNEVLEEEMNHREEETSILEKILNKLSSFSQVDLNRNNNFFGKSVNLFDMKINESSHYDSIARNITDTIGNEYGYENAYSIGYEYDFIKWDADEGYAIYYLGGEYSSMSGKIIVPDDFCNEGYFTVSIRTKDSGDYITIYDTDRIDRQTLTIDLAEYNIDLSKAEWLKLYYKSNNNIIVLKDFCLIQ